MGATSYSTNSYARLRAAQMGDGAAFDALCADLRAPITRLVRHSVISEGGPVSAERITRIVDSTFAQARMQLGAKPDYWSTYGWIAWIARREVLRHLASGE
jgi:hypothetical protein